MTRKPLKGASRTDELRKLGEETRAAVLAGKPIPTHMAASARLRPPLKMTEPETPNVYTNAKGSTGGVSTSAGARAMQERRMQGDGGQVAPSVPERTQAVIKPQSANEQLANKLKKVPGVGSVIRGLDFISGVTKPAADLALEYYTPGAGASALGAAEQGAAGLISKFTPKVLPKIVDKGAKLAQGALQNVPGSVGTAARYAVSKGAQELPNVASRVIADTGIGAITGAGQSLAAHPEQGLTGALQGAKAGAIGGAAFPLLGATARTLLGKYKVPEPEVASPTLGLPLGREDQIRAQRGQGAATPDVISPDYQFKLPFGDEHGAANRAAAQEDLQHITNEIDHINHQYEVKVIDEYKYLKDSMKKGVEQGQLHFDEATGDVVGRTGRQSNNELWYRQFYAEKGRAPSNKELLVLARQRVENGFQIDEAGNHAPSWTDENNFHGTLAALNDVKTHIQRSLDETAPRTAVTTPETTKVSRLAIPSRLPEGATPPITGPKVGEPVLSPEPLTPPTPKKRPPLTTAAEKPAAAPNTAQQELDLTANPELAKPAATKEQQAAQETTSKVTPAAAKVTKETEATAHATPGKAPSAKPSVDDMTTLSAVHGDEDEPRLISRLREQGKMDAEVDKMIQESPIRASRTTNQADLERAGNLIKRLGGPEEAFNKLISGTSSIKDSVSSMAAKLLSAHYAKIGDKGKVYEIIKKMAPAGREAGQFIQSLKQWNLLDTEGVLLAADRQKNRLNKGITEHQDLTPAEQEKFIQQGEHFEMIQRLDEESKRLADMIAAHDPKTPLTDEQIADLTAYQNLVKEASDKVGALRSRVRAENVKTIKEVTAIPPRMRYRDQVLAYLGAQADEARAELARSRNIGFAAKANKNPYMVAQAKIGAYHLATGLVKYTDWAAAMIKRGITQNLPEIYVKSGDRFRKANGIKTLPEINKTINKAIKDRELDPITADALRAGATEIGFASNDVKLELTRDLQRSLRNLGDVTLGERMTSIAYSSMLLNPRTYDRNLISVVQQMTLDKVINAVATPIDWALSTMTGKRTITFIQSNQEKLWNSFVNGNKEGWTGLTSNMDVDAGDFMTSKFRSKYNPFHYTEKLTGASLRGLDKVAYDNAYGRVLGTYARLLGKSEGMTGKAIRGNMDDLISRLDDSVRELAEQEGLRATYQSENTVSKASEYVKRSLNAPTDAVFKWARQQGLPAWASLEGYGLGTVITPFVKTPVNLILHGLDYTPLGIMKSVGHIISGLSKGASASRQLVGEEVTKELKRKAFKQEFKKSFNQRSFVQSLTKAIVGTAGLTVMGYNLYNLGILTGKSNTDTDVRSLEEAIGRGAYKVNVDALRRYIFSGLDKEQAKTQKDDFMMDYSWLQPLAISVGMGVSAAQAVEDAEKKQDKAEEAPLNLWKTGLKAIAGGAATILENPMVQGISKISDALTNAKKGDYSKFAEIATSAPAQFVPSAVNQVRQSLDNNVRETYAKGDPVQTGINQVLNKIPLLSDKLAPSYNSLGNPREIVQGGKAGTPGQFVQNMLVPAKATDYAVSPEAQLVLDMLEQTGDQTILPRVAPRSIQVTNPENGKKKSVNLTPEQFSELQKDTGSAISGYLRQYEKDLRTAGSPEEKATFLKKMLTYSSKTAQNKLREKMGYAAIK